MATKWLKVAKSGTSPLQMFWKNSEFFKDTLRTKITLRNLLKEIVCENQNFRSDLTVLITNQKEMWLPKVSLASSMGGGAYQATVQKQTHPEDKRKTDEESFLLKLIESLRAGFQEQINGLRKEIANERENRYQPAQIGAPLPNQGKLPGEMSNPVYRGFPGMAHPHLQAMMAQQQAQANQWFNQSCQTFSS